MPFSDVGVTSESEDSSDDDLVTVSEKSYHSDGKAAPTYLAGAKKNLPEEESVEEVSFRPTHLSDFEKEHFHRENVMPDRPYTAFFTAPSTAFTTKDIFDDLLSDGIPASAVRCLQRSPNRNVLITFASKCYRDLFLRRSSFVVQCGRYLMHPGGKRGVFLLMFEMSQYDAPTFVGKPLIQVISERNNEPSEPSGTPALFTPLPPEPSPPLASENLIDGSGESPPELPDALLRLQNSGHHLQVVSCSTWNVCGNNVRIRKELSVCFSVDTVITSQDIIIGFDQAGIDIYYIHSTPS